MSYFRWRIRTGMLVVLAAGLWLALGVAMVRASRTPRERDQAVLYVVLVPIGIAANVLIGRYVDAWSDRLFFVGPTRDGRRPARRKTARTGGNPSRPGTSGSRNPLPPDEDSADSARIGGS